MMQSRDVDKESGSQAAIRGEILGLAGLYGLRADAALGEALDLLDFEYYAEYVLSKRGLDMITGGVGQQDKLIEMADRLQVPASIMQPFKHCVSRFPYRMVYLKLCFGTARDEPTLYINLMEPWEVVLPVLESMPGIGDIPAQLKQRICSSKICVLLGFSLDRATGKPVLKTYQPCDCEHQGEHDPQLISFRFFEEGEGQPPKYYRSLAWGDVSRAHDELHPIAEQAVALLRRSYRTILGYRVQDGVTVDPKLYIFRKDVRLNGRGAVNESIYTSEGNIMMRLERFDDAIESFGRAIDYDGRDFAAYTNRSLCYVLVGRHDLALHDAETAKGLEPNMNFRQSEAFVGFIKQLIAISGQLHSAPSADLYNQLGVMLFQCGLFKEAKKNFELALELDDGFAEAHNNLGGACINLGLFSEAFDHCSKAIGLNDQIDTTNYQVALDGMRRRAGTSPDAKRQKAMA